MPYTWDSGYHLHFNLLCYHTPLFFRCYIIDDSSNVIFSEGLREASVLDTRNYNRVPLGRIEPGVMRDLVKEKNFFIPESVQVDYHVNDLTILYR